MPAELVSPQRPPTGVESAELVNDAELAGLDHLELGDERSVSSGVRLWGQTWPKLAAIGLVIAVWQAAVWAEWKKIYVLPSPLMVWDRLWADIGTATLWSAVGTTMTRAIIGFVIALAIGVAVALAVSASTHVRTAIGSMISGLQTMPSIAWFPLAILLFGLDDSAIYFVVVLGAAPSIANGVISGIDGMPPLLRHVGRSMGAGSVALYRDFVVPAAMPSTVSGLKQGWAFAWRSLMAGELLVIIPGEQTIGTRLSFLRDFSDAEGLLATMVVILVIGILVDSLVFSRLERRVLRNRGLAIRE